LLLKKVLEKLTEEILIEINNRPVKRNPAGSYRNAICLENFAKFGR